MGYQRDKFGYSYKLFGSGSRAMYWRPPFFIPRRLGEAKETLANISRARRLLYWKPKVRFEDGIAALRRFHGLVFEKYHVGQKRV